MQLTYLDLDKRNNIRCYNEEELIKVLIEKYKYNIEIKNNNIKKAYKDFITLHIKSQTKITSLKIFDQLSYQAKEWINVGITKYKKTFQQSLIKLLRGNRDVKKFVVYLYSCNIV